MINYKLLTEFVTPKFTLAKGSIINIAESCLEGGWDLSLVNENNRPIWVDRINNYLKDEIFKNCELTSDLPEAPEKLKRVIIGCFWEANAIALDIHQGSFRGGLDMPLEEAKTLLQDLSKAIQEFERLETKIGQDLQS